MWKHEPWLALDLETTSANPDEAAICQIGWVRMERGEVVDAYEALVNPGVPIPAEASAVHGLTDETVAAGCLIEDVWPDFASALDGVGAVLGYNAWGYDFPILRRLWPDFTESIRGLAILDPLIVVREAGRYWRNADRAFPDLGRHTLVNAAAAVGLQVEQDRAHGAQYDCELAGGILWTLRNELPDDGREAQRVLSQYKRGQDARYAEWKAKNP